MLWWPFLASCGLAEDGGKQPGGALRSHLVSSPSPKHTRTLTTQAATTDLFSDASLNSLYNKVESDYKPSLETEWSQNKASLDKTLTALQTSRTETTCVQSYHRQHWGGVPVISRMETTCV